MNAEQIKQRRKTQDEIERKKQESKRWFYWWKLPSDRFAFFVALFTLALVVVGGLQTRIIHNQLGEMKAASVLMQGQLNTMQADQRPWIKIGDFKPIGDFVLSKDGGEISFQFTLENIGKTPAVRISYEPEFFTWKKGVAAVTEQKQTCKIAEALSGNGPKTSHLWVW